MAAFANTASIKWAQRKDSLHVTICLADVTNHTLELTDKSLTFTGTANKKDYGVTIVFFKKVHSEFSISKPQSLQSIQLEIMKKDLEFWPRLMVDEIKEKNIVKIDWDRYVDEDEDESEEEYLEDGFEEDFVANGQDMGGQGGAGGMDMVMQQMGGVLDIDIGAMLVHIYMFHRLPLQF